MTLSAFVAVPAATAAVSPEVKAVLDSVVANEARAKATASKAATQFRADWATELRDAYAANAARLNSEAKATKAQANGASTGAQVRAAKSRADRFATATRDFQKSFDHVALQIRNARTGTVQMLDDNWVEVRAETLLKAMRENMVDSAEKQAAYDIIAASMRPRLEITRNNVVGVAKANPTARCAVAGAINARNELFKDRKVMDAYEVLFGQPLPPLEPVSC